MNGMGSHQSQKMQTDEWLTPPGIIKSLGDFDLDPCSPIVRPWDTAKKHYDINDDGLKKPWKGRVWCNPPYGNQTGIWLSRLADHYGTALIFARTETKMFFDEVWDKADGVLFIKGRLFFHYADGSQAEANAGAPSVLVAYGQYDLEKLIHSGIEGHFIKLAPVIKLNSQPELDLKNDN